MNASESRRYADIVGPDIGDVISEDSIIVLPVGAVEQHGPHLPMSVDDVIALVGPILRHRMALNFAARADGVTVDDVINRLAAPYE